MSSSPPIKPPRGVKYSIKESNGCKLLVSVIKTLDASETNEEREKEKQNIEKEYRKSDLRLNELVSKHDGDLTQIMLLFSKVSSQVTTSKEKIHSVKENLYACKKLLRCRREELKKLWTDAVQQKYVLEMLEQINELRKVPSNVTNYIAKKHYLHATKSLTYAIHLGEGPLRDVDGLNDLRNDLEVKKNQLYAKLIDEMIKLLYHTSTMDALTNFHRQGSGRGSNFGASPFQRNVLRRSAERAEANQKVKRALFEMTQKFDVDKTEIIDSSDLADPELNLTYYIGIIVECFGLLKKVPDSIETIKLQMQPELLAIVTKTTQHLLTINQDTQQHPLLNLLESLFNQFKLIANAHQIALKSYQNVMQRYSINYKRYDTIELWLQAQSVLQLVLTDYLDIQNASADERTRNNFTEPAININTFFNRRKTQNKKPLFKFEKSSHIGAQEDSAVKEHKRNLSDMSTDETLLQTSPSQISHTFKKRDRILVCDPDPKLIKKIYLPMMGYIREIEEMTKTKHQSSLNVFIGQFVKESFLAHGHNRSLQNTIDSLSKSHDAWKVIISPEEMKNLGLQRPLLQSTVMIESKITETKHLLSELPDYSDELLKNVCALLKTYRETCQAAYRGIVQPDSEDKRIQSVAWLADEDITRFLKTLPNWTDLKSSKSARSKLNLNQRRSTLKAGMMGMSEEESPTQVQYRNIKEADMLTSNLGESEISKNDILSDVGILKELAILQESMEWFSIRITEFANDLRNPVFHELQGNSEQISTFIVKDGTIKVLTNLALEFEELANTCLLVLHLEVRVQCFHYLRLNSKDRKKGSGELLNKGDTLEPDAKVSKLAKVLTDMDEALTSTLHPRKAKYIFEGLAHLAARILIMSSNYMEKIDQYGVQLMCRNALALQQTLSSITASREVALDTARNYYEMFYMEPDELITNIVEKGTQFSEMQYFHALQLICKSRGITDQNTVANYQQKLSDILGAKPTIGVTV